MTSDRADSVKKAEKLLRQGKLDLAIAEYVRMVEEQPRDWNTRNTLGDLYVRANQIGNAVDQYLQIADHLFTEGFFPKAAALYKKILKIKPDEEAVQLHLGEISAKQGLLADAKGYFLAVATKRRAKGNRAGADEIVVRLGSLDPSDFDARTLAARILEQSGDAAGAASMFRSMHADLLEKKKPDQAIHALREAVRLNPADVDGRTALARTAIAANDHEGAAQYLDRTIAGQDPALLMPLLDRELRAGRFDDAREILKQVLAIDRAHGERIVELSWTLGGTAPEAAYTCIDTVVDAELAAGNYMDAAAVLQEFVTRVSGQIAALLKLVEIAVDGGLEAIMYEAQAHLADAYLERGQGSEARVIAEDLVAREPWEHAHIDRFRRALVLLQVEDPDMVIAERLAGQGPFIATDPFMASESFVDDIQLPPRIVRYGEAPPPEPEAVAPASAAPAASVAPAAPAAPAPPAAPAAPAPAAPAPAAPDAPAARVIPTAPAARVAPAAPRAQPSKPGGDVDLTDMLSGLGGGPDSPPTPAAPAAAANLDAVFKDRRSSAAKQASSSDAAEYLGLGKAYIDMGMAKEAISALRAAARAPMLRFEAAAMLGRLYVQQGEVPHAIEWLARAAEAPAPGNNERCELLYELGAMLEHAGETARALAIFLELQSDAAGYRDVAARIERLARVQAGS